MKDIHIGWYFLAVGIILAFYLINTQKVELSYSTSVSVGNKGFSIGEPAPSTTSRLATSDVNGREYGVSYDKNGNLQVSTDKNNSDDTYEKTSVDDYWKGMLDPIGYDKSTTPTKLNNLEDKISYDANGAKL